MRHKSLFIIALLTLMAGAGLQSCGDEDLFDKDAYLDIVHSNYPVDSFETSHSWTLLKRLTVIFTSDIADETVSEVSVFTAHPLNNPNAEMAGRASVATGGSVAVTFDAAQTQDTFYAMLVSRAGKGYVMPFSAGQDIVRFTSGAVETIEHVPEPTAQTFTFLYESSFPIPDDFDYNDVVMRICREAPQPNILRLRVTLAAAGGWQQTAAAIRLPGIMYDDVERVEINEGKPFDDNYPANRFMTNSTEDLVRARNNEAVIVLFEDAHWSLMHESNESGVLVRVPCNTGQYADATDVVTVAEQTRTYDIYLKNGVSAKRMLLSDLDPFIIRNYEMINFEVHTYAHKSQEVLWEYLSNDKHAYDDFLAWALVIPSPTFRYPLERVPIGSYRNGEIGGAYKMNGHSFGEWARQSVEARDWWQYPTPGLVY